MGKPDTILEKQQNDHGQPDFVLMILTFILVGIGLVMVYSSSQVMAYANYGDGAYFFKRQLVWAVLGLFSMFIVMNIPYRVYQRLVPFILLAVFVLMALVLTDLGEARKGAQRWLNLGFITIQPSEFVKLGLIMYLSSLYAKKQEYIDDFWKGILPPLFIVGVFFGMILLQRDLGTAMLIVFFTIIMLFCAGARFSHMFGLACATGLMFAIFSILEPFRMRRLISYRDPWADAQGDGYQLIQSLYAIGNGGITGSGFGNSIQKYFYLPEAHTDFIFAVIAEEFGFIGMLIILTLMAVFVLRGIKVSAQAPTIFGTFLGVGIVSMIGIQALINIGVAVGLLPVTGMTLPFLSYGGSSLLITLTSTGILLNISRYTK